MLTDKVISCYHDDVWLQNDDDVTGTQDERR